MALATQCPYCHTSFRVANDQLKLHAGLVRCGACQQTFNGIEHLLSPTLSSAAQVDAVSKPVEPAATVLSSQPDETSASPASASSASALEFDMGEFDLSTPAVDEDKAELASDGALSEDTQASHLQLEVRSILMNQDDSDWSINTAPQPELAPDRQQALIASEPAEWQNSAAPVRKEPTFAAEDSDSNSEELPQENVARPDDSDDKEMLEDKPNFVIKAERLQKRSRALSYLMMLGSLVLLLSLLAQSAYSMRDMIAAWFPQTKPTLQKFCLALNCQITLPAQIDMITIESNELEALETGRNVFSLALQLQNKSSTLQNWPMLELILNDAKGKVLVQRAFPPSEYLTNKDDISKGFGAGSEQAVKLFFESSAGKASAYHVGMFYP